MWGCKSLDRCFDKRKLADWLAMVFCAMGDAMIPSSGKIEGLGIFQATLALKIRLQQKKARETASGYDAPSYLHANYRVDTFVGSK